MSQEELRPARNASATPRVSTDGEAQKLFAEAVKHHREGDLSAADRGYRSVLAIAPRHDHCLYLLGVVALQQGRAEQAIDHINKALAINERMPEWHYNLACAYQSLGRLQEAVTHYRWALALHPGSFDAMCNLTHALVLLGETGPALDAAMRALRFKPGPDTRRLVATCLVNLREVPVTDEMRGVVLRALTETWGDLNDLARVASALFDPAVSAMSARASAAWPRRLPADELLGSDGLAALARDQLLRCLLEMAPSRSHEFERFLTSLRHAILGWAGQGTLLQSQADDALRIGGSLAQQCFVNEYVYDCTDEEADRVERLRAEVSAAIEAGAPIPPLQIVALAAYRPLHTLPEAASLLRRTLPNAVSRLLVQQVQEPLREAEIARTIRSVSPIADSVSAKVRQQYEDNPYPRWTKLTQPVGDPVGIDAFLRSQFPSAPFRPLDRHGTLDVLVAGCGTGQHPILTASQFAGVKVMALDLSRASLAYAKRKTEEIGPANIEYAQADILDLGMLGRTFDVVEAVGVLHHMADPLAGWRSLIALLRPGGVMNIGLYSELGREDVVQARAFIAERGYGGAADDIRRCRQEMLALGDASPLKAITARFDFFATSNCRDLLFHVQEHRLTLPAIRSFLDQNNLQMLGFVLNAEQRSAYAARFPDDPAMNDLDRWHVFETENPKTFFAMYRFWVQKRPAEPMPQAGATPP